LTAKGLKPILLVDEQNTQVFWPGADRLGRKACLEGNVYEKDELAD